MYHPVMIDKRKKTILLEQMAKAGIFEADLDEKFILGSGKGGQKINKTHSTVVITHLPTGITVRCGKDRLRENNRFFARRRLVEKKIEKENFIKSKKMQEIAKIRKQKKRRSKKLQEKILKDKKLRSNTKNLRKKPEDEE